MDLISVVAVLIVPESSDRLQRDRRSETFLRWNSFDRWYRSNRPVRYQRRWVNEVAGRLRE